MTVTVIDKQNMNQLTYTQREKTTAVDYFPQVFITARANRAHCLIT